jgi:serine/threonine-protein kinase RsbW
MSTSIDELAESGRGIKLMWQIADQLSYTRTLDGRNCLLLSKSYEAEGQSQHKKNQKTCVLDGLMNVLNRWDWLDLEQQEEVLDCIPVKKLSLQVSSDLNCLTNVLDWFALLEDLSLPTETWFEFQLALVEGFTNAVCHAHKHLPMETPIQLEIIVFEGRLEFRIWDCGLYFDFDAKIQEFTAGDKQSCLNINDFNHSWLKQSKQNTLVKYQFLIAG